jgi:hypothetical protein
MLTLMLIGWSKAAEVVGDEYPAKNSDEPCGQGIGRLRRLDAPQLDSLGVDDYLDGMELQSFSVGLRVASSDGDETWPELGDVYTRFCSCRQCWASKCRGL